MTLRPYLLCVLDDFHQQLLESLGSKSFSRATEDHSAHVCRPGVLGNLAHLRNRPQPMTNGRWRINTSAPSSLKLRLVFSIIPQSFPYNVKLQLLTLMISLLMYSLFTAFPSLYHLHFPANVSCTSWRDDLTLNVCLRSASGVNPNEDRVNPSFRCAQEVYQWQHRGKQGSLLWSNLRGFMDMLMGQTLLVTYLTAMVPPSIVNRNQCGLAKTSSEKLSPFLGPWGWVKLSGGQAWPSHSCLLLIFGGGQLTECQLMRHKKEYTEELLFLL